MRKNENLQNRISYIGRFSVHHKTFVLSENDDFLFLVGVAVSFLFRNNTKRIKNFLHRTCTERERELFASHPKNIKGRGQTHTHTALVSFKGVH